jgi:proton glutamate symport protein
MNPGLHWKIFAALVGAIVFGLVGRYLAPGFGEASLPVLDFAGQMFLGLLKMLVIPLVATAIISGIAGLRSMEGFARLGWKTMAYYLLTTVLAVLTGLLLVNFIQPGISGGTPIAPLLNYSSEAAQEKVAQASGRDAGDLVGILLRMIPTNVIKAAAEGDMLGMIFFSLLFGIFITRLPDHWAASQIDFWKSANEVMLLMTSWVMKFAPIGVFALVGKVILTTGFTAFQQLAWFFVTVTIALGIHLFITLPALVCFLGRVNPLRHFRAMAPALLTAFSTSSSNATLPLTLECLEKRAGVSRRTSGFVAPLGATVNMDGTALYECVAAMFIAQALGVELSFSAQFTVVLLAVLTSIGVAGIPAASLVAIVIILNAVGLDPAGIGMILAVDRILDMCRTSVNIFSDACGAVIIGKSEGEGDILSAC